MPSSSPPAAGKTVLVREAVGMTASTACVLHCIALPWLATLSAVGAILPQLHLWLALASLALAIPLFRAVWIKLLPLWVGVIASSGWIALLLGLFIPAWELPLTVFGGVCLFVSHVVNLYYHRRRHQVSKEDKSCCGCSSESSKINS